MKRYIRSARGNRRAKPQQQVEIPGLDTSQFDDYQLSEIKKGLEAGVDVSWYADPKFDDWQMREIRKGLEAGVDVSHYADPEFNGGQMEAIREGLEAGVDVRQYADLKFSGAQIYEIRKGLEAGVDTSLYADPEFDAEQMRKIRNLLLQGLPANYSQLSKYEKTKARWSAIQNAAANGATVEELESQFGIDKSENTAFSGLGLEYEDDGQNINIYDSADNLLRSIDVAAYDDLVADVIMKSSNSGTFVKNLRKAINNLL